MGFCVKNRVLAFRSLISCDTLCHVALDVVVPLKNTACHFWQATYGKQTPGLFNIILFFTNHIKCL